MAKPMGADKFQAISMNSGLKLKSMITKIMLINTAHHKN